MVTIALDAMGGDFCPKPEVEGAVQAARAGFAHVVLVGREPEVRRELAKFPEWESLGITICHADEAITMEDSAARAVKQKKNSSIRVATRLVKEGKAQGVVSAGNTGAVMATAKIVLGMVPGVERPALATPFPTVVENKPVVVVDVGANVDSSPEMLAQFGVMGDIYSRIIFHTTDPKVGLLSIGEEEHKGNELTHAATPLLKAAPINFIGNVEGRDLYSGKVDVIVCDGFVGNVALKVSEGLANVIKSMLTEALEATITRKVGYLLSRSAFTEFKKRIDYSEYGGAPLLGVKGVCLICHGSSSPKAIMNAIRVAAEFADGNLSQRIEQGLV